MIRNILIGLALGLASLCASAHDYTVGTLHIVHPWARATPPGAQAGGAFMRIDNQGAADRLLEASAGVADAVELHEMHMEGNVMRMNRLEKGIELPAGATVELRPGGLHVMFVGLRAPLKEGARFPLRLRFEKAGEVSVDVAVQGMGASAPGGHEHQH